MKTREVVFTDAHTENAQLAIRTCPGYEEALERAMSDYWEEKGIRFFCPALQERNQKILEQLKVKHMTNLEMVSCGVRLCFTPYIERLTIKGKCLME